MRRNAGDVGANAPPGEGKRIRGMPEAALVGGDAEMTLAAVRREAELGLPADTAPSPVPRCCALRKAALEFGGAGQGGRTSADNSWKYYGSSEVITR